ncbi:hypothetical protein ACJMK2_031368 [Sinanodonta woodiana]|uniref:Uncharacterized protein n=1 Tax=Sinanodonta woodiana TaxID=1069815 RepID=A0ABD3WYL4_SINWO
MFLCKIAFILVIYCVHFSGAYSSNLENGRMLKRLIRSTNTTLKTGPTNLQNTISGARCILKPVNSTVVKTLKKLLEEKVKLIKFNFRVDDLNIANNSFKIFQGHLFKPFQWMRAFEVYGLNLLLLRNNFDIISLFTLSIGTEQLNVNLVQQPDNCVAEWTEREFEESIRILIHKDLNEFWNKSVTQAENDYICNMYVRNTDGFADFYYNCCQINSERDFVCNELKENEWIRILFILIIWAIRVIVVLIIPRLIPDAWYRLQHTHPTYVYSIEKDHLKLKVVKTATPETYGTSIPSFPYKNLARMDKFKPTLEMIREEDQVYTLLLKTLHCRMKQGKLVSENSDPIGFFNVLFDMFVDCKLLKRKTGQNAGQEHQNCEKTCRKPSGKKQSKVLNCCKKLMKLVLHLLFIVPWIFRVLLFYTYEEEEIENRRLIANRTGLLMGFHRDLTMTLTPVHVIFVIMYICLGLESFLFHAFSKSIQKKLKFELREAFRGMRDENKLEIIKALISNLLQFLEILKGSGGRLLKIFIIIFLSPFLLIIFVLLIFPTCNVTMRLFIKMCIYLLPVRWRNSENCHRFRTAIQDVEASSISTHNAPQFRDDISCKTRLLQVTVIAFCLVSMWSVIVLLTEIVSYATEMFVYTLIGVVFNAGKTLMFLSLAILLILYANNLFTCVSQKYSNFNTVIHEEVMRRSDEEEVKSVARLEESQQQNTAFQVNFKAESESNEVHKINRDIQVILDLLSGSAMTDNIKSGSNVNSAIELPSNEYMQKTTDSDSKFRLIQSKTKHPKWDCARVLLFLDKKDNRYIPRKFFEDAIKAQLPGGPGDILSNYFKAGVELAIIFAFLTLVLITVLAFTDAYHISSINSVLVTLAGGAVPWLLKIVVFKSTVEQTVNTSSMKFEVMFEDLIKNYNQTWPIHDIEASITDQENIQITSTSTEADPMETSPDNSRTITRHEYCANCNTSTERAPMLDKHEHYFTLSNVDFVISTEN